jgi:glycosyltransferase involved in cell wall biosynthesis/glutathione synthase/RimK-type ligase-like ATP-grasp enzyme
MPLAILNHSPYGNAADAHSNAFLCECARWLSVECRVVELETVRVLPGGEIEGIGRDETVVPRADIRTPVDLWLVQSLLRALEAAGIRTVITSESLALAQDRLVMHGALLRAGLPVLPSAFVRVGPLPPSDLAAIAARLGGLPVCLRTLHGWGGMGLLPCSDLATLRAAFTFAHALGPGSLVMLQPYVEHESALTVQMAAGRAVRTFRAWRAAGEARTNPRYEGAVEEHATLADAPEVEALAAQALAACGLGFGTVDLLEAKGGGRFVLEVNCAPGLSRPNAGDRRFAEAIVRHVAAGGAQAPLVRLVVPFALEDPRGNSVSAGRLADMLRREGLGVSVGVADAGAGRPVAAPTNAALVHSIQAWHTGPTAAREAERLRVPLVVSFRGTDLDRLEHGGEAGAALAAVALAARSVTVLTADQRARLSRVLPGVASRVRVVAHGVELPVPRPERGAARARHGIAAGADLVVQVAGVRRAKGLPDCLEAIDLARARRPALEFRLVGPLLEPELGPALEQWLAGRRWARWLGARERDEVLELLLAADVSFHASEREGLSNALLESQALGVPAVARDTAASRSVIDPGANGLLFGDWQGAALAIVRLLEDRGLAGDLARAGLRTTEQRFSPGAELEGYLAAYRTALVLDGPRSDR